MRSKHSNKRKYKTFSDLVFEDNLAIINFSEYKVTVIDTHATPKYVVNVHKNSLPEGQFNYQTPENVTSLLKLIQSQVMVGNE